MYECIGYRYGTSRSGKDYVLFVLTQDMRGDRANGKEARTVIVAPSRVKGVPAVGAICQLTYCGYTDHNGNVVVDSVEF